MNQRERDRIVAVAAVATLLVGGLLTWQAAQQYQRGMMGSMMDSPMGGATGPAPMTYAFGTLVLVVGLVAVYLVVREQGEPAADRSTEQPASPEPADGHPDHERPAGPTDTDGPATGNDVRPDHERSAGATAADRLLEVLPEDERRILEPVVDSPGITQIELRDRADFSKSKVSQTVSDLERRGLLYREPQGRTYRVYPSDDLGDGRPSSDRNS